LIEEIRLTSYRGFQDFVVPCSPVTALVGMNSGGKTSVLRAVQLLCDILGYALGRARNPDAQYPDFKHLQWSADPYYGVQSLNR
jgi:predicted ATP-dependent endonuclease of OLD family